MIVSRVKKLKKKNLRIDMWHLFNVVTIPLMEMTWLDQNSQNRDQIEINKNRGIKSIFYYENRNQRDNLT